MTAQKQVETSKGEAMTLDLTDLGSVGILRVLETVTKQGTINIARARSRRTSLLTPGKSANTCQLLFRVNLKW